MTNPFDLERAKLEDLSQQYQQQLQEQQREAEERTREQARQVVGDIERQKHEALKPMYAAEQKSRHQMALGAPYVSRREDMRKVESEAQRLQRTTETQREEALKSIAKQVETKEQEIVEWRREAEKQLTRAETDFRREHVELDTGEFVPREAFSSLAPDLQVQLKQLGTKAFNEQLAADQKQFEQTHIRLGTGEWVPRETYEALSPEFQLQLEKVGAAEFGAQMRQQVQDFKAGKIEVEPGMYLDVQDWDALPEESRQEILETGFTPWAEKQQAEYDQFMADHTEIQPGMWITNDVVPYLNDDLTIDVARAVEDHGDVGAIELFTLAGVDNPEHMVKMHSDSEYAFEHFKAEGTIPPFAIYDGTDPETGEVKVKFPDNLQKVPLEDIQVPEELRDKIETEYRSLDKDTQRGIATLVIGEPSAWEVALGTGFLPFAMLIPPSEQKITLAEQRERILGYYHYAIGALPQTEREEVLAELTAAQKKGDKQLAAAIGLMVASALVPPIAVKAAPAIGAALTTTMNLAKIGYGAYITHDTVQNWEQLEPWQRGLNLGMAALWMVPPAISTLKHIPWGTIHRSQAGSLQVSRPQIQRASPTYQPSKQTTVRDPGTTGLSETSYDAFLKARAANPRWDIGPRTFEFLRDLARWGASPEKGAPPSTPAGKSALPPPTHKPGLPASDGGITRVWDSAINAWRSSPSKIWDSGRQVWVAPTEAQALAYARAAHTAAKTGASKASQELAGMKAVTGSTRSISSSDAKAFYQGTLPSYAEIIAQGLPKPAQWRPMKTAWDSNTASVMLAQKVPYTTTFSEALQRAGMTQSQWAALGNQVATHVSRLPVGTQAETYSMVTAALAAEAATAAGAQARSMGATDAQVAAITQQALTTAMQGLAEAGVQENLISPAEATSLVNSLATSYVSPYTQPQPQPTPQQVPQPTPVPQPVPQPAPAPAPSPSLVKPKVETKVKTKVETRGQGKGKSKGKGKPKPRWRPPDKGKTKDEPVDEIAPTGEHVMTYTPPEGSPHEPFAVVGRRVPFPGVVTIEREVPVEIEVPVQMPIETPVIVETPIPIRIETAVPVAVTPVDLLGEELIDSEDLDDSIEDLGSTTEETEEPEETREIVVRSPQVFIKEPELEHPFINLNILETAAPERAVSINLDPIELDPIEVRLNGRKSRRNEPEAGITTTKEV